MLLKLGDKVKILEGVTISNSEMTAGEIGTVVGINYEKQSPDDKRLWDRKLYRVTVRLDRYMECLDEWDNCVHFDTENWAEERSCEALICRILERVPDPVRLSSSVTTLEQAGEDLHERLERMFEDWRAEWTKGINRELTTLAKKVLKDYGDEA